MNRLRDEQGQGAIHEKGIDLVRRTSGTPADAELRRRVWAAIKDAEPRGSRARSWLPVRSFAVAGVVLLLGGSAAAMIGYGRHWVWPRASAPAPTPPAVAPRLAPPAPRALAPAVMPAPAPLAASAATPNPSARPRPVHPVPQRAIELQHAAAAAAERTQVLDAMIALRHDHDARRAGQMLDQYLATHPHGALREEALALAIEAATARGDAATARRLAGSYIDGYPHGRFRDFARDTIGADAP